MEFREVLNISSRENASSIVTSAPRTVYNVYGFIKLFLLVVYTLKHFSKMNLFMDFKVSTNLISEVDSPNSWRLLLAQKVFYDY